MIRILKSDASLCDANGTAKPLSKIKISERHYAVNQ